MESPESKPFGHHVRASFKLGVPLVAAQLAQMAVPVIDTLMLGWYGVDELAAGTLAFQLFFIFMIFGLGLGAAMMALIPSAIGEKNEQAVRQTTRMGFWALAILATAFQIPLWFTADLLQAMGQQRHIAELAQDYMRYAQWAIFPTFALIGLRAFLTSIERPNEVLWITIFATVLNTVFNYALIFGNLGMPELGMTGAGIATLVAEIIAGIVAWIYVMGMPHAKPYNLFTRLWRPNWDAFRTLVLMGMPIGIMIFAEAGLFSAATLMMGWIGTVPLAAHGVALQVASVAFMIPLGMSQAVSVRVSNAYGRRSKIDIRRAAYAVLLITTLYSFISAIVFFAVPEPLISIFLDGKQADAPAVIAYAIPLIWVAAAFQLVDGLQAVAAGNLRGLQDTKVPMIMATISYWAVGVTVAYYLAFNMDLGGIGIWAGLAIGLAVAALLLNWRFYQREKLGLI